MKAMLAVLLGALVSSANAQSLEDVLRSASSAQRSPVPLGVSNCPVGAEVIYSTTRASTQGAEITAAANGPATCMSDLVVLAGTSRNLCEIAVDVFTLTDNSPFNLTLEVYTACTTSGAAGSACGTGPGTLVPSSTVTVSNIQPAALGTVTTVRFPMAGVSLASEADNTVAIKINASRANVFWNIGETPTVGSIPAGEPATSFVERCGSTGANNGCQRNFGVTNNFAMEVRGIPATPPVYSYTPPTGSTVTGTGGAAIGSTSTFTITPAIGTAGTGTGAPATTQLTCTAPTAPFAGFGQTVTAIGAGAISGGPLSGTCTRGAAAVTQTLSCIELQGSTQVPRSWTLSCPAGTAAVTQAVDSTSTWSLIALVLALFGFGAVTVRRRG